MMYMYTIYFINKSELTKLYLVFFCIFFKNIVWTNKFSKMHQVDTDQYVPIYISPEIW